LAQKTQGLGGKGDGGVKKKGSQSCTSITPAEEGSCGKNLKCITKMKKKGKKSRDKEFNRVNAYY